MQCAVKQTHILKADRSYQEGNAWIHNGPHQNNNEQEATGGEPGL